MKLSTYVALLAWSSCFVELWGLVLGWIEPGLVSERILAAFFFLALISSALRALAAQGRDPGLSNPRRTRGVLRAGNSGTQT